MNFVIVFGTISFFVFIFLGIADYILKKHIEK
jgi:hypothetical protein